MEKKIKKLKKKIVGDIKLSNNYLGHSNQNLKSFSEINHASN